MDPSSASCPDNVVTKDLKFQWIIDFKTKVIRGTTTLFIQWLKPTCPDRTLVLDVHDLVIKNIHVDNTKVEWKLSPNPVAALGAGLEISCQPGDAESVVVIEHETMPTSAALQWLDTRMTADRLQPFLFSQCQATLARALFPCQDTPLVKCPFTAVIHAPPCVKVLMGARHVSPPTVSEHEAGWLSYSFTQPVPIPSYLVALVCGALETRQISSRCGVWAEPSLVAKAADEFADIEKLLQCAEGLCGPYEWGVYDVLVLPPTFPYGGMENPCLTFTSPTIVVGDRSMVKVLAHEISHSWIGNLVTNSTWEHFWLNEGHTTYLERLLMEQLHSTGVRKLCLELGYQELKEEVERLGASNQLTKLVINLKGIDTDKIYSRVPYEKGSLLLYYLETLFGKEKMLQWLRAYVKKFAGKALDTATWLDFLVSQLGAEVKEKVDWDKWLYGCGLPPWEPKFEVGALLQECDQLVALLLSDDLAEDSSSALDAWSKLNSQQREIVLNSLSKKAPLSHDKLSVIDRALRFSSNQNAELRVKWSLTCIRSQYMPALESCLEFLNSQGQMKYTRQLYRELVKWPQVKDRVVANFVAQRPNMHRTTAMLVELDIGLK